MNSLKVAFFVPVIAVVVMDAGCVDESAGQDQTAVTGRAQAGCEPQQTPGTQLCAAAEIRQDEAQNLYYMSVRGMTFPFRTPPCREAANVCIEAKGRDPAGALGAALLRRGARIVLAADARDGNKTQPALDEVALYLQQASTNAPERVTLPAEQEARSLEIERLRKDSATVVLARGPAAGARKTRVSVDSNMVLLEGSSYEHVVRAADRAVLELAAVFCGTKACGDPVACSQGKSCGCKNRRRR